MTLLLTARDVAELLPLDQCIDAVERAFRAHGLGQLDPSGVLSAHAGRGALHIKTASLGRYFVAKTNANFPGNRAAFDLPTIQGLLLLFDTENGTPLAVMDSIEITALRTAAASAVAAKHLARRGARVVEIYGCGRQGRVHLEALSRVFAIEGVIAHDLDPDAVARLGAVFPLVAEGTPDIIVTCTTSKSPFLCSAPRGAFIAAVGADNPEKSEIDPALMQASTIVTDVTEQAIAIGDLHHAPGARVHAQLGEVVAEAKPGRTSAEEIIVFDSTGVGFQDAAAAALVYERAIASGRGARIDFA